MDALKRADDINKFMNSPILVYVQICEKIKGEIFSGVLSPGIRLPSIRYLAKEYGVNPNTVQGALLELKNEDFIYSRIGYGNFVVEDSDFIEKKKGKAVNDLITNFLTAMRRLGISYEETVKYIYRKLG